MLINIIWWFILTLHQVCQIGCLKEQRYLVNSDYCRIPDEDPYSDDVMKLFKRIEYEPCTMLQPLTWVAYNASLQCYVLSINQTAYQWYLTVDLELTVPAPATPSCCAMEVHRSSEFDVQLGDCMNFQDRIELSNRSDGFIVRCYAHGKLIYTNGHATVPEYSHVRQRLNNWAEKDRLGKQRAPSVLMIGMDTISRLNLIRAMPRTQEYLKANGWFEMSGYNKVEDNTIPNFAALTAGYNLKTLENKCNFNEFAGLDKCEFIWNLYQKLGYVTAFGEDDVLINTFNYNKRGFAKPPVDYYMRPFLIAAEQLLEGNMRTSGTNQTCLGFKHAAEYIYDYALEFAARFRNDSFFGFFWTNTHSHGNQISRTSAWDGYMVNYLQRHVQQGTMEHSVVVLLSDHGIRHGPARNVYLGWLEERLPFLYIWLPAYLKEQYPQFVQALTQNNHRLTNPFDLYVTLKHIATLSGRIDLAASGGAKSCRMCQSLLLEVPLNRTCAEAAIAHHWCTCWSYRNFSSRAYLNLQMATKAVQYINKRISHFELAHNLSSNACHRIVLRKILTVNKAIPNKADDPHTTLRRLRFLTNFNKVFEVTVLYNSNNNHMLISGLSDLSFAPLCIKD